MRSAIANAVAIGLGGVCVGFVLMSLIGAPVSVTVFAALTCGVASFVADLIIAL
mgnify:FL=1